jgi:Holliday junction resolvasome RuvABC endonuclease subunit
MARLFQAANRLSRNALKVAECATFASAVGFLKFFLLTGALNLLFEEVRRHVATDAAHAYGGFLSHLEVFGETRQIPYEGVPVGTIKKHATGKGNANKLLMIAAMQGLGYNPVDDNEADALALLHYAIERY